MRRAEHLLAVDLDEEIINLERQISSTKAKIENEIKQIIEVEEMNILALKAEENVLQSSINETRGQIRDYANKEYEYSQLSRGIDDNREVYSMFLKQREEARISLVKLHKGVRINVISPGVVPTDPIKPRKQFNIILAVILGIAGGFGLAFLQEYFDHTFTHPAEIEQHTELPALGSVRIFKNGKSTREVRRRKIKAPMRDVVK